MLNNTEVIELKNENKKSNKNKLKIKKSTAQLENVDSFFENTYLILKDEITHILNSYKHVIAFILITFSIYAVIAMLEILYLFHVDETLQKLSFALSIISILSTVYVGIRHEKAKIHTNVVDFIDDLQRHLVSIEMFSSNLSICIIRLEKIELLNGKKELIQSDDFYDFEKILNEEFLKSYVVTGDDIFRFEILGYNVNILKRLYGETYEYPKSYFLSFSFKRYDGKKNIDVLVPFNMEDN